MFEEHKYEELKKLGTELHIPIFEAFLKMEVFDKNGNLVQEHSQRSHSWVRNAYNMMFSQLAGKDADDTTFGAGKLSGKDTGGNIRYGNYPFGFPSHNSYNDGVDGLVDGGDYEMGYRGASGYDDAGIVLGSGTTAESFEDYVIETPIVEGTGAGQISYVASQAHAITYTAGTKVLKNDLIRYFNNNTGGNVSVNEVALYGRAEISSPYNFLMSRDVLGATVTVADTGQLKVTFTIQITFAG